MPSKKINNHSFSCKENKYHVVSVTKNKVTVK